MKTALYYFSGTGNSLKTARYLKERLPGGELKPIISCPAGKFREDADCVGFIFPIHNFTLPIPVRKLMRNILVKEEAYLFAAATRGGSPCHVFRHANRALARQKKSLDAAFYIDAVNNFLLIWETPSREQAEQMNTEMEQELDTIVETVQHLRPSPGYPHGSWYLEHLLFPIITAVNRLTRYFRLDTGFYADTNCDSCGTCEKVCSAGRIEMSGGRPVWTSKAECNFCFACIHLCPRRAIQVSHSKTAERGRYCHPEITPEDIAAQKNRLPVPAASRVSGGP